MIPSITTTELKDRLRKNPHLTVIDVRSPEEFSTGAVPGAINIPTGQVQQRLADFKSAVPVYVICQSGMRSKLVTLALRAQGITNLVNVSGGMNSFQSIL